MSNKRLVIHPTSEPSTTVAVWHVHPDQHRTLQAFVTDQVAALDPARAPAASAVLTGRDRRRVAAYLQWHSADDAATFLASSSRRDIEESAASLGAVGAFRHYAVAYVNDSRDGAVSHLEAGYRGVFAVNEVRTLRPTAQADLTRVMIRTDSVARRMPFHHSTNLHVSADGESNLNVLQFRYSLVRVVLWFILRFGRTTEALDYGTPDVHFYDLVVLSHTSTDRATAPRTTSA
ncbi:MAG: hypothetical protein ACRCY8_00905 [Dermatophilaceae bacterium]